MWTLFYRLLSALARYGSRAVNWAWANRARIFDWFARGYTIDWIINYILRVLGI